MKYEISKSGKFKKSKNIDLKVLYFRALLRNQKRGNKLSPNRQNDDKKDISILHHLQYLAGLMLVGPTM